MFVKILCPQKYLNSQTDINWTFALFLPHSFCHILKVSDAFFLKATGRAAKWLLTCDSEPILYSNFKHSTVLFASEKNEDWNSIKRTLHMNFPAVLNELTGELNCQAEKWLKNEAHRFSYFLAQKRIARNTLQKPSQKFNQLERSFFEANKRNDKHFYGSDN